VDYADETDSVPVVPSPSTSLRTGPVEEWSEWDERHRRLRRESGGERAEGARVNLSILFPILLCQLFALPQRGRFFVAAFKLKHHSLDVLVVLVPTQELQTFLWIAPLQNLDGFPPSAPRIHFTLIRHV
jgi:hypothetical protein